MPWFLTLMPANSICQEGMSRDIVMTRGSQPYIVHPVCAVHVTTSVLDLKGKVGAIARHQ